MKNKKIAIILTAILIGLATFSNISAQTDQTKKFEVSGEYSYVYARQIQFTTISPNGWSGGAGYKFNKWFSIYGEGGQEYGKQTFSDSSFKRVIRTSALAGVRISFANKTRFTPFINGGIGNVWFKSFTHSNNGQVTKRIDLKNALYTVGEGLDIALNHKKTISWRIGAEYRRAEVGDSADNIVFACVAGVPCPAPPPIIKTGNAFRFHTGIVFNF